MKENSLVELDLSEIKYEPFAKTQVGLFRPKYMTITLLW